MGSRGRPKNPPTLKEMIREILPPEKIYTKDELEWYNKLVSIYMSDFNKDELTSGDVDDIMDLAKNRILEFRLLKDSKGDSDRQVDVSTAIEKLRKQNEKIKESLSTRRRDRVNPNETKGFSIVDLVAEYDNRKKKELEERVIALEKRNRKVRRDLEEHSGNRYDQESVGGAADV